MVNISKVSIRGVDCTINSLKNNSFALFAWEFKVVPAEEAK